MGLKETILCDWLGLHSYESDRQQRDAGYRKQTCTRCGDSTFDPR